MKIYGKRSRLSTRPPVRKDSGFTLVEVAIALLVIGLLTAPLIQQYHQFIKRTERQTTQGNLTNADIAIQNFYFENDRYPCPADPTLGPNDANYGQGDCTAASLSVIPVADVDGNPGIDNVWIGALPFKDLKLTPNQSLDGWGNKINYAVTDVLAQPPAGGFNGTWGLITINQLTTQAPGDPANTCNGPLIQTTRVHRALFSNGADGVGAFPGQGGAPVQACPAAGATRDEENCDNDDAVFSFPTCIANDNADATHYDDLFLSGNAQSELTMEPMRMFNPSDDPNNTGTVAGYIGINNPDPQAHLDIIGNLRASDKVGNPDKQGRAQASEYCATDGSGCFSPESIADYDPDMNCDGRRGMSGINENEAKCSQAVTPINPHTCDEGDYVAGITPTGDLICVTPP